MSLKGLSKKRNKVFNFIVGVALSFIIIFVVLRYQNQQSKSVKFPESFEIVQESEKIIHEPGRIKLNFDGENYGIWYKFRDKNFYIIKDEIIAMIPHDDRNEIFWENSIIKRSGQSYGYRYFNLNLLYIKINGKPYGPYNSVISLESPMAFSDSGYSSMYIVDESGSYNMYINGVQYGPYQLMDYTTGKEPGSTFSKRYGFIPGSEQWYFWFKQNERYSLNLNGDVIGSFDKPGKFFIDHETGAYIIAGQIEEQVYIYENNKKFGPYSCNNFNTDVTLSEKSKTWCVKQRENNEVSYMIIDGSKKLGPFEKIHDARYDEVLQLWAFVFEKDARKYLMSGNTEHGPYSIILLNQFTYSGLVYAEAKNRKGKHLVYNNFEYGPFAYSFSVSEHRNNYSEITFYKTQNGYIIKKPGGKKIEYPDEYILKELPENVRIHDSSLVYLGKNAYGILIKYDDQRKGKQNLYKIYTYEKTYGPFGPYIEDEITDSDYEVGYGSPVWFTAKKKDGHYLVIHGQEYGPFSDFKIVNKEDHALIAVIDNGIVKILKVMQK